MRLLYDVFGETPARGTGDWTDRLTPWILALLGGLFLGLMLYGYYAAAAG